MRVAKYVSKTPFRCCIGTVNTIYENIRLFVSFRFASSLVPFSSIQVFFGAVTVVQSARAAVVHSHSSCSRGMPGVTRILLCCPKLYIPDKPCYIMKYINIFQGSDLASVYRYYQMMLLLANIFLHNPGAVRSVDRSLSEPPSGLWPGEEVTWTKRFTVTVIKC